MARALPRGEPARRQRERGAAIDESRESSAFERLQLVRRIDWRFLLPTPRLDSIVCAGRPDAALLRALAAFGTSLTVLGRGGTEEGARFGLAVAVNPTRRELKALSLVLEPGGALYVELRGYVRPRARLAAPSLGAVERRLARLGFVDVRAHWQFPDAAECEEIVPLTSARTIRYALTRKRRTLPARAKGMLARAALAAGAFPTIISSRSVTARLPEARR